MSESDSLLAALELSYRHQRTMYPWPRPDITAQLNAATNRQPAQEFIAKLNHTARKHLIDALTSVTPPEPLRQKNSHKTTGQIEI